MGTHIDVLFPRRFNVTASKLAERLTQTFSTTASSLLTIKEHAWYSIELEPWHVTTISSGADEPAYIKADGPYGFDVNLYDQVCSLGHPERFRRLHVSDSPVSGPLQDVICSVVVALTGSASFACVAGGMGDSDQALDLAYYEGAGFTDACKLLETKLGAPAHSWSDLDVHRWLLHARETANKTMHGRPRRSRS
ncbi:hypothetical protein [Roseimaritima ulvae]|uniref:Uncharacterized protein n=1 Tax=Roseimaritima ulvae TaxID=980254 RepID=A0A5B9QN86_9BACT|nr:hypothetical protein [Roseimaritima ulvae]QEG40468.1 hypothetical protein UC8_24800 [Roseimaritima ulvae]